MPWVVSGSCNHCGLCCHREGGVISNNPCIDLNEDVCKFYVETDNNKQFGHCLIIGRGNKPISSVKDRFGKKITQSQIDWFNHNCPEFPVYCLDDLVNKKFNLPLGCSFFVEEIP